MRAIGEVLNTITNNEYYGKEKKADIYDSGYDYIYGYVCALLDILDDPKFVRSLYINGGEEELVKRFNQIIPNSHMTYQTIYYLNTINKNYLEGIKDQTKKEESALKDNIKKYYEAKTKKPFEDNPLMQYYLDKASLTEIINNCYELDHNISYNYINNYKRYINIDEKEENCMKALVYQSYFEGYHYLTAEEILKGSNGLQYEKESDIDFEKIPDGTYKVPIRHMKTFEIALDSNPEVVLEENAQSLSM